MIELIKLDQITTSGDDGSATGNATSPAMAGRVLAVYIDYSADQPATTDVTLATVNAPVNTILTVSNNATDGWYYPRAQAHDETGAGITYDGTTEVYEPVPFVDQLRASVAGADDGETVDVWIVVETK